MFGDDEDFDEADDLDEYCEAEPRCSTCGGDGFVDSVAQESGRHGWDPEGPGTCTNCNGSGLRKDQQVF